ncbi:MAG: tetratricopeptide repeat protein [bacterium]
MSAEFSRDAARTPRVEFVLWAALLFLVGLFGYRAFDSTDTAVHILAGREMIASHRILDSDPFSFTVRGAPWFVNQWIPEIIFAAVHGVAGVSGLVWLRVMLLCATFGVLAAALRADPRIRFLSGAIVLLVGLYASYRLFVARPLLFSSLYLAILIAILESFRRGGRDRLVFVPLLFIIWVNSHAGFVFGAILFAATLAAEAAKHFARGRIGPSLGGRAVARLALVFAISIVASAAVAALINPRGFQTVLLPFGLLKSDFFLTIIGEYQRADARDGFFWALGAILIVGLFARLVAKGIRGSDLTDWMTTLPFAYQAWQTHRVIFPFALVAAPAAARGLSFLWELLEARGRGAQRTPMSPASRQRSGTADGSRRAGASGVPGGGVLARAVPWMVVALIAGLAASRVARDPFFGDGLSPVTYPREACLRLLREGEFSGNLFHNDVWAGAVALYGWPRYPLFIDGRLEVYGEAFWRDVYFRILGCGDGWEQLLDRYRINAALLRVGSVGKRDRIGSVLRAHPGWALVYWDELTMLYVRRIADNAAFIREHEVSALVDPENLAVPAGRNERTQFLAEMDRALEADPASIPALYGAVNAAIGLSTTSPERAADASPRVSRYLPLVRDAARQRLGRGDWRLPWIEGRILLHDGDGAGATSAFARARRLGGGDFDELFFDELRALSASGRADEAGERLAERAANVSRGGGGARAAASLYFAAGRNYAAAGEGDLARAAYAMAAERDPSRAEYFTARAWSFVVAAKFDDAVRAADAGLARFPRDPYLVGTRGWALFRLGELDGAERALRDAIALLPREDRAARAAESAHLGEVLLARGTHEEARRFLNAAVADSAGGETLPEIARARALLDSLDAISVRGAESVR